VGVEFISTPPLAGLFGIVPHRMVLGEDPDESGFRIAQQPSPLRVTIRWYAPYGVYHCRLLISVPIKVFNQIS
ncbi:MAG: hypothetical protein KAW52_03560, partial [candidate division Zixibacteria bacterium]|nr:hypothetical protein [candidate division Zixibacteria bacterium]